MDVFSKEKRSQVMSRIRSKDSKPEKAVRSLAHRLGYRFRLHSSTLPGKPDLVFPSRRKVVFVHGCFWHQHEGCRLASSPSSNKEYWEEKLAKNVSRDRKVISVIEAQGWDVLIIWECQARDEEQVRHQLVKFLGSRPIDRGQRANNGPLNGSSKE